MSRGSHGHFLSDNQNVCHACHVGHMGHEGQKIQAMLSMSGKFKV